MTALGVTLALVGFVLTVPFMFVLRSGRELNAVAGVIVACGISLMMVGLVVTAWAVL